MSKTIKVWPDYYTLWQGDFSNLVSTSNEIVSGLGYDADITERSVRNYQHKALVGRGLRQGKASLFSFGDLADLVATKTLVKEGWSLSHTAAYLSSSPTSLSCGSSEDPLSKASPASRVVSDLMNNAIGVKMSSYQAQSISNSFFGKTQPAVSLPALQNHYLAPGFVLSIDNASWSVIPPEKQSEIVSYLSTVSSSIHNIIQGK